MSFSEIKLAFSFVFSDKKYILLEILFFALLFVFYLFLLPSTYTGGIIGLVSLRFLNFKLGFFAFFFALFLSLILSFFIFSLNRKQKLNSGFQKTFFGTLLPSLLCCSPLLPLIFGIFAGIFPSFLFVSGFIQGFLATYETEIYLLLLIFLAYSFVKITKQILNLKRGVCG